MPSNASPASARDPDPVRAARVLRRLRQVFTGARAHYQQVEKRVGLGGAQVWALGVIAEQPGLGVGALGRALQVHQSTASNLVRALTERALVIAERDAADRRVVCLRASAAGLALLAEVPGPFTGLLPQALDRLDGPCLARLEHDLAALVQAMGMDDDAPALPIAQL